MKKFILMLSLVFMMGINVNAQDLPWYAPIKLNEDGLVELVVNYEIPGKSQAELYAATKVWFSERFANSKNVIELDEKEAGIVSGNGNVSFMYGNIVTGYRNQTLYFSFKCQMKDGKYRLTINSFKTDNQVTGRTGIEYVFTDNSIKKNGEIKEYPAALKKEVLGVFDLVETTLSKKINEKDDF
jgi:hypothetical protein